MKFNKRLLIESLFVSFLIVLMGLGWIILQGYFLIKDYEPDIISAYESVDYLQSKVAFGFSYKFGWVGIAIGLILLTFAYYGTRILINKLIEKYKK